MKQATLVTSLIFGAMLTFDWMMQQAEPKRAPRFQMPSDKEPIFVASLVERSWLTVN